MKSLLPALLGGAALLLALVLGSRTLAQGAGNVAALAQIMGDAPASGSGAANAYLSGLAAYAAGDDAAAAAQLTAALPTHGTFARQWLALSLERAGKPQSGRAVLDVTDKAERALYGDILLREWQTAPAADKQGYLALLQAHQPAGIVPYANRLIAAGYPADAETWVRTLPGFDTSPDALVTLGSAFYEEGRLQEAEPLLERAYRLRADAVTAYWYGTVLAESDQPELGAALLAEAAETADPDTPLRPWMLRAMAVGHARAGRCAEAEAAFDQAAASDSSAENQARVAEARTQYGAQCEYEAAWLAYQAGEYAEAAALFKAAIPAQGAPAQRQWALSLGMLGRAAEAVAALNLTAGEDRTLYSDLLVQFWPQFSATQKDAYLAQLRTQAPEQLGPLALRLADQQAYDDAAAWAEAALALDDSPEALLVLGQAAYRQDDLAAAEQWFSRAYALHSGTRTDTLTGYWYGRTAAFGSQPDRGTAILEQTAATMTADDPLLPWLLRDLGVGYVRAGRCLEADAAFKRAVAVDTGAENQERIATAIAEYGSACDPPLAAPERP